MTSLTVWRVRFRHRTCNPISNACFFCTGVACDCTNHPFTHCFPNRPFSLIFPSAPAASPSPQLLQSILKDTVPYPRERDGYRTPLLQNTVTVSKDRAYPSLSMASTVCPRTIRFASPKKKSLYPFLLCFNWRDANLTSVKITISYFTIVSKKKNTREQCEMRDRWFFALS